MTWCPMEAAKRISELEAECSRLRAQVDEDTKLLTGCFKRFVDYMQDAEDIPPYDFCVFLDKIKERIL